MRLGLTREAVEAYRQAVEIEPRDRRYQVGLAGAERRLGVA